MVILTQTHIVGRDLLYTLAIAGVVRTGIDVANKQVSFVFPEGTQVIELASDHRRYQTPDGNVFGWEDNTLFVSTQKDWEIECQLLAAD